MIVPHSSAKARLSSSKTKPVAEKPLVEATPTYAGCNERKIRSSQCYFWDIPSGYLSHSHGIDGPLIDGLPINSMVIFHGYVSHNQMVPGTWSNHFFVFFFPSENWPRHLCTSLHVDDEIRLLCQGRGRAVDNGNLQDVFAQRRLGDLTKAFHSICGLPWHGNDEDHIASLKRRLVIPKLRGIMCLHRYSGHILNQIFCQQCCVPRRPRTNNAEPVLSLRWSSHKNDGRN